MEIVGSLCCLGIMGGNAYVYHKVRKENKKEQKQNYELHKKHAASQTEMFIEEFRRSSSNLCGLDKLCGGVRTKNESDTDSDSGKQVIKKSLTRTKKKASLKELPSNPINSNIANDFFKNFIKKSDNAPEVFDPPTFNSNYDNRSGSLNSLDRFDIETEDPEILIRKSMSSVRSPSIAERMRESSPVPIGLKGTVHNNNYEHSKPTT